MTTPSPPSTFPRPTPPPAPTRSCSIPTPPSLPATERKPKTVGMHGDKIQDPYFWLREKKNPAVLEHLKAENTYTAAVMAPFKAFEDKLYNEIPQPHQADRRERALPAAGLLALLPHRGRQAVPHPLPQKGQRRRAGGSRPRREQACRGDKNSWRWAISTTATTTRCCAYSTDVNGHRDYDFHLKNLATGEEIKTPIGKVSGITWAADNKTLFVRHRGPRNQTLRQGLTAITLGEKAPTLVYEDKDELFDVAAEPFARRRDDLHRLGQQTHDGISATCSPTIRKTAPKIIAPRRNEIEYYPEHREDLVLHPHQRRREGIPRGDGPGGLARDRRSGTSSSRTTPGSRSRSSSRSRTTPWSANAPTRCPVSGSTISPPGKWKTIPLPEAAYDTGADHNAEFDAAVFPL